MAVSKQKNKTKHDSHKNLNSYLLYSKSIKNVTDADGNENMEPNCEGNAAPT